MNHQIFSQIFWICNFMIFYQPRPQYFSILLYEEFLLIWGRNAGNEVYGLVSVTPISIHCIKSCQKNYVFCDENLMTDFREGKKDWRSLGRKGHRKSHSMKIYLDRNNAMCKPLVKMCTFILTGAHTRWNTFLVKQLELLY